jgi:hypothetical protein
MSNQKSTRKRTVLILAGILLLIVLSVFALDWKHQSRFIDGRPHDTLVYAVLSGDGTHRMEIYRNEGRALIDDSAATMFIYAINEGERYKGKDVWCLYFALGCPTVEARWINDEEIEIRNIDSNEIITTSIYTDELYSGSRLHKDTMIVRDYR